jgi:putative CocE/NonD family hydrolase
MTCIGWTATMLGVFRSNGMSPFAAILGARKTKALTEQAIETIPLRKADSALAPNGVSWWQDWMDHAEPHDPWWDAVDYGQAAKTMPATVMVAGWHDIFLPWQLRDFMTARQAGRDVRIVIGPWMHAAGAGAAESLRQSIALFQRRFGIGRNQATPLPPVRLYLMGADEWREYQSWPVSKVVQRTYYLDDGGVLASSVPVQENISSFDYDPARPTPSFYGPSIEGRKGSGDMAELERRSDVLLFTSEPLSADLDVIGPVSGEIFLRSSTEHADLYLCLCDVAPGSRSTNVCDGYTRLRPDPVDGREGVRKVHVEFWPTAYRFRLGHRIRIIAAGGAHPRYSRNPGSGESLGDACTMLIAHQEILHGPEQPSAIKLPVLQS